jgi:hypothetical protein
MNADPRPEVGSIETLKSLAITDQERQLGSERRSSRGSQYREQPQPHAGRTSGRLNRKAAAWDKGPNPLQARCGGEWHSVPDPAGSGSSSGLPAPPPASGTRRGENAPPDAPIRDRLWVTDQIEIGCRRDALENKEETITSNSTHAGNPARNPGSDFEPTLPPSPFAEPKPTGPH